MRLFKIITHPYIIIFSFFAILISGEHLGGFYLLYLLLGLPYAATHSLMGFFGVILLLITYNKFKRNNFYVLENILNLSGDTLLILSLLLFFNNDKDHYNIATFYNTVPLITLFIFVVLSIAFLVNNVIALFKNLASSTEKTQL